MSESLRVGVTGAAGYIGSGLTARLLGAGHDVVALDNGYDPKVDAIEGCEFLDVDVRDRATLRETLAGVDAIVHLAAITGVEECEAHQQLAFDVNVGGTENLAWLCREWGTPLVFPASMAIIGDPVSFPIDAEHPRRPLNLYGLTKAMSEEDIGWLADGAFPAMVLMKSNLFGNHTVDGQTVGKRTVINLFVERVLAGDPLTVHEPGTQSRDFVHVDDVIDAYELAIEHLRDAEAGCRTIPVAGGETMSVLDLANLVQRVAGEYDRSVPVELVENPRDVDETIVEAFDVDLEAARQVLGYEPSRSVEHTVREMLDAGA